MISCDKLSRHFNGIPAVEDLSFEIAEGKLFTLLGPNGAGKTTTIRLLLGLIGPTSGGARVAGYELGRDSSTNAAIRAACGLLTESPGFYDRMSAWDNLLFFARLYGIPESQVSSRVERYLRFMELWERRESLVGTFSRGMKQKLAIIRAIFHEPKVIFMDEPTAGLDPEASVTVREMVLKLKHQGRTIVVCTHNLDEAQRLADLVGILKQRLLVCDTLANLQSGAGGGAHVQFELRDGLPQYQQIIRAIPSVKSLECNANTLLAEVVHPRENVPRIVKALVNSGAEIIKVHPQSDSLETIYLRCIHGGGNNR